MLSLDIQPGFNREMTINSLLLEFLGNNQIPLIFVGSFFFGDAVILSLAVFAAYGMISLPFLFLFGFAGTIISDAACFFLGSFLFDRVAYIKTKLRENDSYLGRLDSITRGRPFLFLLLAKFLYGTRIIFITYLSARKLKFSTFILFNSLGTSLWLAVLLLLGWIAGKGTANFIPAFKEFQYLLTISVILFIFAKVLSSWLTKKITKE